MTATGHAIIGTVIAAKIGNPYLAIPIAILSHVAADAFPHWDTGTNRKKKSRTRFWIDSLIDLAISLTLPLFLGPFLNPSTSLAYIYLIVIAAQLLDWLTVPYLFLKINIRPFTWIQQLQLSFDNRLDKPWGVITQAAILLFLIIFAKLI